MFYSVRHITRFRYSNPVREIGDGAEDAAALRIAASAAQFPDRHHARAQLYAYTDHFGNAVYHFNVLREHSELRIERSR
jgi:hypothetical protein